MIAHRGASGYRPEHTRAAFDLAIELGADAVEPDLVPTRDGVLVIRHENEVSATTDVAQHPEFASRRTTKSIDGRAVTGWFTEDFTWAELTTLRTRERLPKLRPANTAFDDLEPLLRLDDLLELLDATNRAVRLVAELKHASYFASIGLPLDELVARSLGGFDHELLTIESFELTVLERVRSRGVGGRLVYLVEAAGSPADRPHETYASALTVDGLTALARTVDGVSVDKRTLLAPDAAGSRPGVDLVERAHAAGLEIYCWTLRAENEFLQPEHRLPGRGRDLGDWRREFGLVFASGVDGVFADQPDLAIEARDRALGDH